MTSKGPEPRPHAGARRELNARDQGRLFEALQSLGGYAWDYDLRGQAYWRSSPQSLSGRELTDDRPTFEGFLETIHPDDRDRLRQSLEEHRFGRSEEISCEYRLRTADDRWLWVQDIARATERDERGFAVRIAGVRFDIDARKRNDERQSLAQQAGRIGTYEIDLGSRRAIGNAILYERFGLPVDADGMSFEYWIERVHPDDRPAVLAYVEEVRAGHERPVIEYRMLGPDGSVIWTSSRIAIEHDAAGRPFKAYGTQIDITEQKRAEIDLARREAELRVMIDQALVGVLYRRIDGPVIHMNQRFTEIFGYSRDDVAKVGWEHFIHPDDLARTKVIYETHLALAKPFVEDLRFVHANGATLWCRTQVSFILDDRGNVVSRVVVLDDITSQKVAEADLAKREAELSAIHATALVGICHRTLDGNLISANARYGEILGRAVSDLVGMNWRAIVHPDDVPALEKASASLVPEGEPIIADHRCVKPDGTTIWCRSYISYIVDEAGRPRSAVNVIDDITELKTAADHERLVQRRLEDASRMLTAGMMGITMAHQLQQPHTAANAYLAAARQMVPGGHPDLHQVIEDAQAEVRRAGDLVRDLKRLLTKRPPAFVAERLSSLFRDVIDRMSLSDGNRRPFMVDINPDSETVLADRTPLQQALEALARNAIEASPAGTTIRITAAPDGEAVRICIYDGGRGLDPAIADRALDLFSTTKEGALGLGLPTARTIIEAHGGRLWFDASGPVHGVCFTVPAVRNS